MNEPWQNEVGKKAVFSRNPLTILYKVECYALYEGGYLGNKPKTWGSRREIVESGWRGLICVRSKRGTDRTNVEYNRRIEEIPSILEEMGLREEDAGFNQAMPDEHLVIQGEVCRLDGRENLDGERDIWTFGGLGLRYTTVKDPMNRALAKEDLWVQGINARLLLSRTMDTPSQDNLTRLLQEFPDSAIEFSTYDIGVGNLGHNTIFWEVRNY